MISSLRGLIVLAACALALLIALIATERGHALSDRTVFVFDPAHVTALRWSGDPINVVRSGQGWAFADAPKTPVVTRAVEDVITSLRSAHWHRRGGAHPVHRTLSITIGSFQHEVGVSDPLAGTDQVWIVVDGSAFLVDGWLAKLLDPSANAFRDPTPLASAATATTIAIHGAHELAITSQPWRTNAELVAPELCDALASALAKLQLVASAAAITGPTTTIELPGVVADVGGACAPNGVAIVVGGAAPACVGGWPEVLAAIEALERPDVIDRRPAGFAFDRIAFADSELVLGKQPTITIHGIAHPADPDRIAELLHALAEPGEPAAVPTTPPAFTLALAPVMLDVYADVVHRRREPHALRISAEARAILARAPIELVDAQRWAEEPTTITQIELDGVAFHRGAAIGEWTGGDPALVEALATAVAKLRAPARPGTALTPHHLRFTVGPPIGAAITHELALGPPTATGCPAVIDRELVTAPLALCTAVAALIR